MKWLTTLLIVLAASIPAMAQVVINTNATIPLASSQLFYCQHGDLPVDGSVQNYNPPIFKWIYNGDDPWHYATDQFPRIFRFQLSTNAGGTFSSLYWDITTSNNFYNTLPAITNADGSPWTGTNYWRIIYSNSNASSVLATGVLHNFKLAATATNWDRSMLADSNYLYSALSPHPHLLFWDTNRTAVSTFVRSSFGQTLNEASWTTVSNRAITAVDSSWWTNESVFTNLSSGTAFTHADDIFWACFVYQICTNQYIADRHPEVMVDQFCRWYMSVNYDRQQPYVIGDSPSKEWPMCVDYVWNLMDATQRSNCVYAMEQSVRYYVYQDWWFNHTPNDATRAYPANSLILDDGAAPKGGNSHPRFDLGVGMVMCMSGWAHSQVLRDLFPYFINNSIAEKNNSYGDEGRAYNMLNNTPMYHNLPADIMSIIAFRSAKLEINPVFNDDLNEFSYLEPVNYRGLCEPWGDLGYGLGPNETLTYNTFTWPIVEAYFMGHGAARQQYNRQNPSKFVSQGGQPQYDGLIDYYFPAPTAADWTSTYYLDTDRGYCVVGSLQPNDYAAFTNGVGFVTQARPDAHVNHGMWSDGTLDIWAYGTKVTAGGANAYQKHPMFHSGAILVDGIGINVSRGNPVEQWNSRFIAFTNDTDFAFVSSDTTKSYNRSNFTGIGSVNNLIGTFYDQSTNKRPYLSSMTRNVLFPHKKYFVLYDSMTSTTNATFQWVWHCMETNNLSVNTNGCSFTYTCTNFFNGSNVTVYVVPFIDPATMTLTNTPGTNNYFINPFTHEDYTSHLSDSPAEPLPNGSIWVYNSTPATSWHFGWVVYPAKWGQAAPTITRLDDQTVVVDDGVNVDTNTFNPNYSEAFRYKVSPQQSGGGSSNDGNQIISTIRQINASTLRVWP